MLDIISESLAKSNSDSAAQQFSELLFNCCMAKTSAIIRRENLRKLRNRFGTMAALNRELGRGELDATLGQILNASKDSKTGKPRQMGDRMARGIEEVFRWAPGTMDAPLPDFVVREPEATYLLEVKAPTPADLSPAETELITSFRYLLEDDRRELLNQVLALAERQRKMVDEVLRRHNVTGYISAERAAEQLPMPPTTDNQPGKKPKRSKSD